MDKVWTGKKLKMNSCGLLRDAGGGRRNTFTAGNGHHPGGFPGDAGKAGKPEFAAGAWHRRAARGAGESGQPGEPDGEPGQLGRPDGESGQPGEPEQRSRVTGRSGPVRLGNQPNGNGEAGRLADPEP